MSLVLQKWESVMAEKKKKAYQRFGELIRQETAPPPTAAQRDLDPMDDPLPEPIPIRLSPEMRRALEQYAAAQGTTPSEIVQEALRRYFPWK